MKQQTFEFSSHFKQKVKSDFKGGNISSDGGLLLLRELEKKTGILCQAAQLFEENRQRGKIQHTNYTMLSQRVFALALGWEDVNDHHELRKDKLLQMASKSEQKLASAPTLCRFENRANRHLFLKMNKYFVKIFLNNFKKPPQQIIQKILKSKNPNKKPTILQIPPLPPPFMKYAGYSNLQN